MNKDGVAFIMRRVCFIIKPWWDVFGCLCSDAIETTWGGAWQATCRRSRCSASVWSTEGSCSLQRGSDPRNTVSDACFYFDIWPIAMRCRATARLQLVDVMSTVVAARMSGAALFLNPLVDVSKSCGEETAIAAKTCTLSWSHVLAEAVTGFAKCACFYYHKPLFLAFTPFTFLALAAASADPIETPPRYKHLILCQYLNHIVHFFFHQLIKLSESV